MTKCGFRTSSLRVPAGVGSPFWGNPGIRNDRIKITLIATAGVLVEHNGVGLLVDGIHHESGHPFSMVPEDDLLFMRQGRGIFANLDYLLFTHEHPDHFTPKYVSQLIHLRPVKGLFLPNTTVGSPGMLSLVQEARDLAIPCWNLSLSPGKIQHIALSYNLSVTVIGTRHMGSQYQAVPNDCFLVSLAGKNLLFTGDGDYVRGYFEDSLAKLAPLDVVFVNPIFYHNPDGQQIINDIFRPRRLVIYHLPFAQDDTMQFSYMVKRDVERLGRSGIHTHILSSAKQSLSLSI